MRFCHLTFFQVNQIKYDYKGKTMVETKLKEKKNLIVNKQNYKIWTSSNVASAQCQKPIGTTAMKQYVPTKTKFKQT